MTCWRRGYYFRLPGVQDAAIAASRRGGNVLPRATAGQDKADHAEAASLAVRSSSPERGIPLPAYTTDWGLQLRISAPGFTARRITRHPQALARARAFTRHTLESWDLDRFTDDVLTVTGELVCNAVHHGLSGLEPDQAVAWLGLIRNPTHLVCAVTDPSNALPVERPLSAAFDETGRGLHIIEALTEKWGCTLHSPTGKTVWAVLPTWPTLRDRPL
ncbi:ATP-binding protein [Streptomyces sp. NPDC127033]|uniref:ATP-binding protein n=1 Tax=Streptomyces sp. NPDC127033 TaxID=3347110 RepID=UPI0036599C7B